MIPNERIIQELEASSAQNFVDLEDRKSGKIILRRFYMHYEWYCEYVEFDARSRRKSKKIEDFLMDN